METENTTLLISSISSSTFKEKTNMFNRMKKAIATYRNMRALGCTRAMSVGGAIGSLLGIVLGGYLTAYTLPDTLSILMNQTMWDAAVGAGTVGATIGGTILGLVVLFGTVFIFLRMVGIGGD